MRGLAAIGVFLLTAVAVAQLPAPSPSDIRSFVKQLGSEDYAEREAASKRLDAIGGPTLEELRAALRSENPEVVRRARELVRKIEHRLDNEKTLAPTLVTLDAKNERLDDVLAGLSKQAECEVVLNGFRLKELADRPITVSTKGKVPFWDAVIRVCDAADLKVAGAGGFFASEALPLRRDESGKGVRSARYENITVVLEARGTTPRRPAAIFEAVLVEALPFPKDTSPPPRSTLLHIWPEPRLAWGSASGARVRAAIDAAGERLSPEAASITPPTSQPKGEKRLVLIRNPDGTAATLVTSEPSTQGGFSPNVRQAIVSLKSGDKPLPNLKELSVTLLGTVRSEMMPLSCATGLGPNAMAVGKGPANVELTVTYGKKDNGRFNATATVRYDRGTVTPAGPGVDLPYTKPGRSGTGNQSISGVRITDSDGKPFILGLMSGSNKPDRQGRETIGLTLELHPDKDGHGPPATATFWGTYAKPVEVPVVLKDVPLSTGK